MRLAQGTEPGRASAQGGPVSSEHQRQVGNEVGAQDSEKVGNVIFTLASFPLPLFKNLCHVEIFLLDCSTLARIGILTLTQLFMDFLEL